MIRGIGIDLVSTSRIEDAVGRWGSRFLERVFTEGEIAYSMRHATPYPQLAARFAAKEAVIKALGGAHGLALKDIEVIADTTGKPMIRLPRAMEGVAAIHLSLTHERGYAAASVVIER
jgi:holo-[acyl-carrier protein] synthase